MKPAPIILHLHIPKSGGETLNRILYKQLSASEYTTRREDFVYGGVFHYPGPHPHWGFFKDLEPGVPQHARKVLAQYHLNGVVGHFSFGLHEYLSDRATYISIIRDPVDRVLSLFHYAQQYYVGPSMTLEEFVRNYVTEQFAPEQTRVITDNDQVRRISGLEPPFGKCDQEMLEVAKENIRQHFTLVGLTDRFDETLILLKRRLGWVEPLIYWPENVNLTRPRKSPVPGPILGEIRELNTFDRLLYEFVKESMDDLIRSQGDDFRRELSKFQKSQAELANAVAHNDPDLAEKIDASISDVSSRAPSDKDD